MGQRRAAAGASRRRLSVDWRQPSAAIRIPYELRIDRCGCGSIKIPIAIVMHEVGHVVGMFHVEGKEHVMHTGRTFKCRDVIPSPDEQYHAALIYSQTSGEQIARP